MKNQVLSFVSILLCGMCLVSCKSADDAFSRDSIIASIVNLEASEDLQELEPAVLCDLWKYKLNDNLENGCLSPEEKSIITSILAQVTPDAMTRDSEEGNALEALLMKVGEELSNIGWDDNKTFVYLGTILTIDELKQLVANKEACGTPVELDLSWLEQ